MEVMRNEKDLPSEEQVVLDVANRMRITPVRYGDDGWIVCLLLFLRWLLMVEKQKKLARIGGFVPNSTRQEESRG